MTLLEKFGDLDVFWATDHAQLEIRVLAQMSGDKLLIELIKSGEDIHAAVGHELTGIPLEKIKKDRAIRTTVKGIHFGIVYGLTADSLYLKLKADAAERNEKFEMTKEEVTKLYNRYFQRFRGVSRWLEAQVEFATGHGYVKTLFGFKREIALFGDDERSTYWGNQSKNSPIQGTAHQLLLIAFAIMELKKNTYNLLQRLSMEGHDALVGYTKVRQLPDTYRQAKQLLEKDVLVYVKKWWPEVNWSVPLKAEAKAGFRYGVLVKDYMGEPPEEFLQKWCEENHKFEKKLREDIEKSEV
jgi:DNA polymerase-1